MLIFTSPTDAILWCRDKTQGPCSVLVNWPAGPLPWQPMLRWLYRWTGQHRSLVPQARTV